MTFEGPPTSPLEARAPTVHRDGLVAPGGRSDAEGARPSAPAAPPGPDWVEYAHRALRGRGHRVGTARERVIQVLARRGRSTALQLTEDLSRGPDRIAISSVYRSLTALVDAGAVRAVELGGTPHYEPAGSAIGGGRYVVCRRCGRSAAFESGPVDRAVAAAVEPLGFAAGGDDVVVHGTCVACSRAGAPA